MGQKVNPISNRLGIIRGWDSNWFGGRNFGDNILEDSKIRKYLDARLAKASVSRIVIERTPKLITITVCTSRPGIIIGKGGAEVDKLKEELKKITDKDVQINIFEVKKPDLDANIVGKSIARQVEGKIAYRRAIKMAIANAMRMGAEGIKVQICGRLNGAEMARKEMFKEGRTPLHTLRHLISLLRRNLVAAMATETVAASSAVRETTTANQIFQLEYYVTTEKNKIQKTAKRPLQG